MGKAKTMNSGSLKRKTCPARVRGKPDSTTFLISSNTAPIDTKIEEKAPTPNKNGGSNSLARYRSIIENGSSEFRV